MTTLSVQSADVYMVARVAVRGWAGERRVGPRASDARALSDGAEPADGLS